MHLLDKWFGNWNESILRKKFLMAAIKKTLSIFALRVDLTKETFMHLYRIIFRKENLTIYVVRFLG